MAIPNINQLPIIRWNPAQNQSFVVKSFREGHFRKFELIQIVDGQPEMVRSTASLRIKEIGNCFQRWIRADDLEVRMFATENKENIYFVVSDLTFKEIAVFSESLDEEQWKSRLHSEEPYLKKSVWDSLFSRSALPSSITWINWNATTEQTAIWKKSYEKSEVDLIREQAVGPGNANLTKDEIFYATHAFDRDDRSIWTVANIIRRERAGNISWFGKLLEPDTGKAYECLIASDDLELISAAAPNWVNSEKLGVYAFNDDEQRPVLSLFDPANEIVQQGNNRNYLEFSLAPDFMPNLDLAQASNETIRRVFIETSLVAKSSSDVDVKTDYANGEILVSKVMKARRDNLVVPTVEITLKRNSALAALKSLYNVFPPVLNREAALEREENLYGRDIRCDDLARTILFPRHEERIPGIEELNRAHERCAEIKIFITCNRLNARILVDQTLFRGYLLRRALNESAIATYTWSSRLTENLLTRTR